MKQKFIAAIILASICTLNACKKDTDPVSPVDTDLNAQVISDFSVNIANATYVSLSAKTSLLFDQVTALEASRTQDNLTACRQTWKEARQIWEQSEAHLFGPVETDNIDPHIDTWPVNFTDLDAQLSSGNAFTEDYINNLEDALKGFHPIEYVLFGPDGTRTAVAITTRQMEYLKALSLNVKTLTANLSANWNINSSTDFYASFKTAGRGSTVYTTQEAALEQLVSAMTDICDEVANSKMKEPYDAQDPSLEESPFAQSSMTDFKNNITGIQNVYLGKFLTDGSGLNDVVRKYNLSLDADIQTKLSAALNAMNNITEPFGKAILDQHVQVEAAMSAINDLKTTLEDQLLPFIKQHAK